MKHMIAEMVPLSSTGHMDFPHAPSVRAAVPPVQGMKGEDEKPNAEWFVNRGAKGNLILACNSIHVSQAEILKAAIEGESAERGLREFDATEDVIAAFGFNADHYRALTSGPKSAQDLIFLREIRSSGGSVRMKGRLFDLYLMKGEVSYSTVLVERIEAVFTL